MGIIVGLIHFSIAIFFIFESYSKIKIKGLDKLFLIYLVFLMAGNTGSGDTYGYKRNYTAVQNGVLFKNQKDEIGFYILEKLCVECGLNFYQFKIFFFAIIILLLMLFLKKYANDCEYIIGFYALFSVFYDIEQMRNAIGSIILCYAIMQLLEKNMIQVIKYIVLIVLASLFHQTMLVYLFLLLIFIDKKHAKKVAILIAIISMVTVVYMFMHGNKFPYVNILINFFSDNRKVIHSIQDSTRWGFVIPFSKALASILTILIPCRSKLLVKEIYSSEREFLSRREAETISLIYKINIISFAFFPFYMLGTEMYRLSRNLMILNFLAQSYIVYRLPKHQLQRAIVFSMELATIMYWFYWDIFIKIDEIFIPAFGNNLFWGILR